MTMTLIIIGLTILGFALIIFDIMVIPGGIVIAVGSALICYAIYLNFDSYGIMSAAGHLLLCIAVVPFLVSWSLGRVALKGEMTAEDGYIGLENQNHLVGQVGTAISDLRPSGTVMLGDSENGERVDCIAEGGFIDKGNTVIVTECRGPSLVVMLHHEEHASPEPSASPTGNVLG